MSPGQALRIYRYLAVRTRTRNGRRVRITTGLRVFLHLRVPFAVIRSAEFDNIDNVSSFGPAVDKKFSDRTYARCNVYMAIGAQYRVTIGGRGGRGLGGRKKVVVAPLFIMHRDRPLRKGANLPRRK